MARLTLAAAALMLFVPALALADGRKDNGDRKAGSKVIPAGLFGEAKPAGCSDCGGPGGVALRPGQTVIYPYAPGSFGSRLDRELWWENHECAPDGCPKPLGCGNFWTEHKFIFGSCRQFFGTSWSTSGRGRQTVER